LVIVIVGGLLFWRHAHRLARDEVVRIYQPDDRDADDRDAADRLRGTCRRRAEISRSWAKADIADHIGLPLTVLTLVAAASTVFATYQLLHGTRQWFLGIAQAAGVVGTLATAALIGLTRQAYSDSGIRRSVGVLWDVGTFWPRAAHPFAPPCYAERAVPELVNRLRRIAGDKQAGRDDPALVESESQSIRQLGNTPGSNLLPPTQRRVLLTGYSQGSPIAAATVAQLPATMREPDRHVALLTLASPLRRLYGRAFPNYFGNERLKELAALLCREHAGGASNDVEACIARGCMAIGKVRWRNIRGCPARRGTSAAVNG
jgi:hypothetical protein